MKYKKILMIGALTACCLAFQAQPVRAQETTETGEISTEEMPAEEPEQEL